MISDLKQEKHQVGLGQIFVPETMTHSKATRVLAKGHRSQSEGDSVSIQGMMMIIDCDTLIKHRSKSLQWLREKEQKGMLITEERHQAA